MGEIIKYLELKTCLNYTLLGVAITTFGVVLGLHAYSEVGGVPGIILLGGGIVAFLIFAGFALVTLYQIHAFKSR
ncbi:unnamed protein product, partial [marine sediment metagenome]